MSHHEILDFEDKSATTVRFMDSDKHNLTMLVLLSAQANFLKMKMASKLVI
jgi:hypothetical protein